MKKAVVAAMAAFVVVVSCSSAEQYTRPVSDAPIQSTPERLARGTYLVNHVMACGLCHSGRTGKGTVSDPEDPAQLLAGATFTIPGLATIHAPNLTPDVETGLGTWKDDEIVRAIRDGVDNHGELLFAFMPFYDYRLLSDEDVSSVVVYLRSVPATKSKAQKVKSSLSFPMNILFGMMNFHQPPVKSVPDYDRKNVVAYGETLAHLAHCTGCHNAMPGAKPGEEGFLTGNPGGEEFEGLGKVYAKNLTPHMEFGLGKYSAEQIEHAMRTGTRLDGKRMAPPMINVVGHYAGMTPEDLGAIVAFLKSIPPVAVEVPDRQLTPEGEKVVAGWSLPAPAPAVPVEPKLEEGEAVPPATSDAAPAPAAPAPAAPAPAGG